MKRPRRKLPWRLSRKNSPRTCRFETLESRLAMAGTGFGMTLPGSIGNQVIAPSSSTPASSIPVDILVTNTNDAGAGSLRWAITQANNLSGPNRIVFQLANNGTNTFLDVDAHLPSGDAESDAFVIRPNTALPDLVDASGGTIVDGRTQTTFFGDSNPLGPEVVLDGSNLVTASSAGLTLGINSHHNVIAGLNIHSFPGDGISIIRSNANRVFGNSIGTDPTGSEARPNGRSTASGSGGIRLSAGARQNVIGIDTSDRLEPGSPNLIAGNRSYGVRLQTGSATDQTHKNAIRGNAIGTLTVGNGGPGVLFVGIAGGNAPANNVVEGNVMLGNSTPLTFVNMNQALNQVANNIENNQQLDNQFRLNFGLTREQFIASRTSPTAEFTWSMEPRTGPGYQFVRDDFYGQIPNVTRYVNPPEGYAVTLDAGQSRAVLGKSISSYVWFVRGLGAASDYVASATGERPTLHLHEGRYSVSLVVTDSGGQIQTAAGEIFVNDILIVSMGDSYASGEGNPHIPVPPGGWAMGGNGLSTAYNQAAHRSIFSAPAQAAWLLEQNDPHTSVTFVSVASTGAEIAELFLRGQDPVVERHYLDGNLPPQLEQVLELTQKPDGTYREIDRLLISAGGNDSGFANVIRAMLYDDYEGLDAYPENIRNMIPVRYANLAHGIATSPLHVARSNIYVTGYPDPTTDESPDATPDEIMGDVAEFAQWVQYLSGVDASEIRWARANVIGPLNASLRYAANKNGWNFIDLEKSLWGHGYSAERPWVVTWDEAIDRQGRDNGALETLGVMHPNELGNKAMAVRIANAAFGPTFEGATDPAPSIENSTNAIFVNFEPPAGTAWPVQSIEVSFSEPIDPATFGPEDVTITAPDGTQLVAQSVRPIVVQPSLDWLGEQKFYIERCVAPPPPVEAPAPSIGRRAYSISFVPVSYGTYLLSIGPEIRDASGRAADYDGDGISAYRAGGLDRDTYVHSLMVAKPGESVPNRPTPEPIQPAVGVAEDGSTIGSITQYGTTTPRSWSAQAPLDPNSSIAYAPHSPALRAGEIDFTVATINTYLRNSNFHELYNAGAGIGVTILGAGIGTVLGAGVGAAFGAAAAGAAVGAALGAALPLTAGTVIWEDMISNSDADNSERAALIRDEFLNFDIVAMQEVFDPDQVEQLGDYGAEKGSYQLRGPGRDGFGKWPFRIRAGADAGLSLFVKGDLSNQVPPPPKDVWEYRDWLDQLDERYDHHSVEFTEEGSTSGADWLANKGFTLDRIQLGSNANHFVYVVNTHMNSQKEPEFRAAQIRQLGDYVDRHTDGKHPVVFLGDFNMDEFSTEYATLLKELDYPYDPFHNTRDTSGTPFYTADPNRNSYKYFDKDPQQPPGEMPVERIDYILIRQGSEFGIRVLSTNLEDGTDRPLGTLATAWSREWEQDSPEYFAQQRSATDPDYAAQNKKIHHYLSDHFGLSARLAFGPMIDGPKVVATELKLPSENSAFFYPYRNEHAIQVRFDRPVSADYFSTDDVRLLGPDGKRVLVTRVRPAFTIPDKFSPEIGSQPASPPSSGRGLDFDFGDQTIATENSRSLGDLYTTFEIEFTPRDFGDEFPPDYKWVSRGQCAPVNEYLLMIGPNVFDSAWHPMMTPYTGLVTLVQQDTSIQTVSYTGQRTPSSVMGPARVSVTTNEDEAVTGTLRKDEPGSSDTRYRLLSGPAYGTASVNSDGTFHYSPAANFHGFDAIQYAVSSAGVDVERGALFIGVSSVNDAPAITGSAEQTIAENEVTVAGISFSDGDGTLPTIRIRGGADAAKFSLTADNLLRFKTSPDFENPQDVGADNSYEVTIAAEDSRGAVVTRSFRVLVADTAEHDFGDAPASYGTLLSDNGARHFAGGPMLGQNRDLELTGQARALADGDDSTGQDDDDGVQIASSLLVGLPASIGLTASAAGKVDAWIDYDRNGIFSPLERIALGVPVLPGTNAITVNVPATAALGTTFARFRISTLGGLSPIGPAKDGEVEDYVVQIAAPQLGTASIVSDPQFPSRQALLVVGSVGNDNITVKPLSIFIAAVNVVSSGRLIGTFAQSAFQRIIMIGSAGNDFLAVDSKLSIPATLYGDGGNDQLVGGGGSNTLFGGPGEDILTGGTTADRLVGGAGNDQVIANVSGTVLLADTSLSVNGVIDTLNGLEFAILHGSAGNDAFTVSRWTRSGTINGQGGMDSITAVGSGGFTLSDSALTRTNGTLFNLSSVEEANLSAGAGHDLLDASGFSGRVKLDGGAGNDTLIGGKGSAILVGGAGNDLLKAGLARSLLIGGLGIDQLDGGIADDLLIGGRTRFDSDAKTLWAILDEWNTNKDFATRVNALTDANGKIRLREAILDDLVSDTLRGSDGLDWFFAALGDSSPHADRLTDPGEKMN